MPITVLIVEDEAMTAMFIKSILTRFGYTVLKCVNSGESAVKYAAELKPELIIMDILLAGEINGIEAAKEIKKVSDIPLIFMSGYSDDDIREEAESLNPVAYMVKPLNKAELKSIINSFFTVADE